MTIRALQLIEQTGQDISLKGFEIVDKNDTILKGSLATYDSDKGMLTVTGRLIISTPDGNEARLNGLVWNRETRRAFSRSPVSVKSSLGTIHAQEVEFLNDFKHIIFSGGVHAKIASDLSGH